MAPYDDWSKVDDDEDEELQDTSYFESKKDVILFCIDCSPSMHALYEDSRYEGVVLTSRLHAALEAAMNIQKKKVIIGPNDSVGILLFNTTRKNENNGNQGSEIKQNTFLYQPISPLSAPTIQELVHLLDASQDDPEQLNKVLPPLNNKRVPMGDVFTSCNWVLRDGAPKTATKRVFLITDEDDPHSGPGSKQLITSAKTTLIDLTQAGVTVEPFFLSTAEKPFNVSKFYSSVLLSSNLTDDDEENSTTLLESISVTHVDNLFSQMRFHEVPKRALFSIPFQLANGFTIGVKGYGLVTEQRKGAYKYFADLGDRMEVANVRTSYIDEERQVEVDKTNILYGTSGGTAGDDDDNEGDPGVRVVQSGQRPFYTPEEVRLFRTLGLEPSIKLLGFKDQSELLFEDNIKHSLFVYPDETSSSGSKRTFSSLLKSMVKKKKVAIVLALTRRNSSPLFCALLPQEEQVDKKGWIEPAGFHLIPLPFADDIREANVQEGFRASEKLKDAARAWIDKLPINTRSYVPDSYPNPALEYHNAQLQASAFHEQYDPESFEDRTEPHVDLIHEHAGKLIEKWKQALVEDKSANIVAVQTAGVKRKADTSVDEAEIRGKHESGSLAKLRVDQLKDFCKGKSLPVSGKKAELVDRVAEWLDEHN
ncbi:SPOC like C-terminal domain-containing protein [Desarmillaria tabescens]|uniref:ATP-dependent DNA helicase II subunit 1 n=1 Tax=Armillaria tabescens TaxID=1929756 RepID=A0AA39NRN2_ARMTA|nr:SPOC like C-terminal domain-containing protein [Desarmillaria tabescens]KAK0470359.1 SPOC like C-terminal domain-containing protein [Desarmillaria tabescens]